ncbi:MAG: response regulator transcription factor [Lentimicrobiaceae bacterium]|nr:response regulator transcription factor [Lentimicrobiaceae bacterium]MCB9024529.1 response regulator transcription factor [Lentimicrobiaceae bacterium]HPG33672.1 response regulator transcription factor [Lentimicrobium sp.]
MDYQNNTILLVDDEADILDFLSYNLRKEGFTVFCSTNGKDALKVAQENKPGLIILDVMMPGADGFQVCREIRNNPALKDSVIAFLSARGEEFSQIEGFDAGADDYIRKPVKPRVFVSRVKALMRRQSHEHVNDNRLYINDIVIDKERYMVLKEGREIEMSKKEFELLLLLAKRQGKVFSREEIFTRVWGDDVIVGERTIDVHIRKIREKIGIDNIKTIKGVGYYFS